jgi:hypothetical protein
MRAVNDEGSLMRGRSRHERRTARAVGIAAATALAGLALLGAGCGGSPANGGAADDPGQASAVKYSKCMRSHGVTNFPDPVNGRLTIVGKPGDGLGPDSPTFKVAEKACRSLQGAGKGPSPAQSKEMQQAALKYAACLRSHGVPNFPDPVFSGGGMRQTLPPGVNPGSAQFKAAEQACRDLSPMKRGEGSTSIQGGPGKGTTGVMDAAP